MIDADVFGPSDSPPTAAASRPKKGALGVCVSAEGPDQDGQSERAGPKRARPG